MQLYQEEDRAQRTEDGVRLRVRGHAFHGSWLASVAGRGADARAEGDRVPAHRLRPGRSPRHAAAGRLPWSYGPRASHRGTARSGVASDRSRARPDPAGAGALAARSRGAAGRRAGRGVGGRRAAAARPAAGLGGTEARPLHDRHLPRRGQARTSLRRGRADRAAADPPRRLPERGDRGRRQGRPGRAAWTPGSSRRLDRRGRHRRPGSECGRLPDSHEPSPAEGARGREARARCPAGGTARSRRRPDLPRPRERGLPRRTGSPRCASRPRSEPGRPVPSGGGPTVRGPRHGSSDPPQTGPRNHRRRPARRSTT